MKYMKSLRTQVALVVTSMALLASLAGPAGASAAPTSVTFNGNPCYVWGMHLTKWTVVVDSAGQWWGGSGRTIRNIQLRTGSHRFAIQSWCNGIFLGRGATGGRWVYPGGGNQNFWAGVFT